MTTPIQSLIECGSKVWLDTVDPKELDQNLEWGITGATSNPKIIAGLVESGQFDDKLSQLLQENRSDEDVAWKITDHIVSEAQEKLLPTWEATNGDDGYVSFELDPLLEDPELNIPLDEQTQKYIELGQKWSAGHKNRMIKVPNTPAGVAALEKLAAMGVTLNVTLTFTAEQYLQARDAIWRGAQQLTSRDDFKSVYSIFVSRVDAYTQEHVPQLSSEAQGRFAVLNAKRIWQMNLEFWANKQLPLKQEIVFASTGPKIEGDSPRKYVGAFAGSDIVTNPPEVNRQIQEQGHPFERQIEQMPPEEVVRELDQKIDMFSMHEILMQEGIDKFAKPQKKLRQTIVEKRAALQPQTPS